MSLARRGRDRATVASEAAPQIETERTLLRPWLWTDARVLGAILSDPEVLRGHFGTGLGYRTRRAAAGLVARVSDVEARRAITSLSRHWAAYGYGEWALEERSSGELIGKVGFVRHDDWRHGPSRVEIGWTLARRAWGRGLAAESARAALEDGFRRSGLEGVISIARHDNVRSLRVMEKLGMRREGMTRWRGSEMVWYSLGRGEFDRAEPVESLARR
jgi:RimJ/RimL family protein N-acetyltransferase